MEPQQGMLIFAGLIIIMMVILIAIEMRKGHSFLDVVLGPREEDDSPPERHSLFGHLSSKTEEKLADIGIRSDDAPPPKSILKTCRSMESEKPAKNVTFGHVEVREFDKHESPSELS